MKRKLTFFAALVLLGLVMGGLIRRGIGQSPPPCTAEFVPRLQTGIGLQAPPPSSIGTITPAIANAAFFMQYRSGVSLSSSVQQLLAQLEEQSMPGNCNGVCKLTRQEVKNVITAMLTDAVTGLTDAQISAMSTGSFRVVPCGTFPQQLQWVQLQVSGMNVSPTTFVQSAQQLRNGDPTLQSQFASMVSSEVDQCCNVLAYAIPSPWNTMYYSPYQVFVIAYSIISKDHLGDSYSACQTFMSNTETYLSQHGNNCPCTGRCLWGDLGYIYTRPVSILFSDAMQTNLLNRYAAVHGLG
jgi:hypothetical protein